MTPEERNLIQTVLQRIEAAAGSGQPLDAESDRLIREAFQRQPAAPYLAVQALLVQDHALRQAQARIGQLEADLARSRSKAAAAATAPANGSTSFLGTALRDGPLGASQAVPPPLPSMPPASGLAPAMSQGAGGGFLRGALTTAAGVAGGALLFEGIGSLLHGAPGTSAPAGWLSGHDWLGGPGAAAATSGMATAPTTLIEKTVINPLGSPGAADTAGAIDSPSLPDPNVVADFPVDEVLASDDGLDPDSWIADADDDGTGSYV
jgi:hypothetical protein